MARKTTSFLNQLKRDVQTILDNIDAVGSNLDAGCHDLSKIIVHDVKTDSDSIDSILADIKIDQDELANQLKQFKEARKKYLEFF